MQLWPAFAIRPQTAERAATTMSASPQTIIASLPDSSITLGVPDWAQRFQDGAPRFNAADKRHFVAPGAAERLPRFAIARYHFHRQPDLLHQVV